MKNIGIICEGPTDYIILKKVIDTISGESNYYVQLQPEADLTGQYGNGWKGVWKWCHDNAAIRKRLMRDIQPALDLLVIQMDGDVSRKEKSAHCRCPSVRCRYKESRNPLECDITAEGRANCSVLLPCPDHRPPIAGYREHLKGLLVSWLKEMEDVCIVIPCDSTEAWIIAAYDNQANVEFVEEPWESVIAKKKDYHNIRISGKKKRTRIYEQFAAVVCENWHQVTRLCESARDFEQDIRILIKGPFR